MNGRRVTPRTRRRQTGFLSPDGDWRELVEPDGPPSGRQLARLNGLGMLELVDPGEARPLTKAEAAAAITDGETAA